MNAVILATISMFLQDIFGVLMMQFEGDSLSYKRRLPFRRFWRDYVFGTWKDWAAAWLDQAQWIVGIATTTVAVTAFAHPFSAGHLGHTVAVFLGVSIANVIGSKTGQEIGIILKMKRLMAAARGK